MNGEQCVKKIFVIVHFICNKIDYNKPHSISLCFRDINFVPFFYETCNFSVKNSIFVLFSQLANKLTPFLKTKLNFL